MKMPPPFRNGMYAAYSAARSRMLSDSTPGRAPPAASAAFAAAPVSLRSAIAQPKQSPVIDQQRLGDEARHQRMREQRTLSQQRPMIAKERHRRHPARERRRAHARVGILPHARAGSDAREVDGPRDQPIDRPREARATLVLAGRVDACGEARRRQPLRIRQRGDPRAPLVLHGGIGVRQRRERRAAACASARSGSATPCATSHDRASASVGSGAASLRQRETIVGARRAGRSDDENQIRAGRRLLERLEQRIRRSRIHPLGRRDHGDLRALAMARELREVDQRAHAVDRESGRRPRVSPVSVIGLQELEAHEIRMLRPRSRSGSRGRRRTRGRPRAASRTAAPARDRARARACRSRAVRGSAARARESRGARASCAGRCVCHGSSGNQGSRAAVASSSVRSIVAPRAASASRCASSTARTSASGRVLSITRKRRGSSRARSR